MGVDIHFGVSQFFVLLAFPYRTCFLGGHVYSCRWSRILLPCPIHTQRHEVSESGRTGVSKHLFRVCHLSGHLLPDALELSRSAYSLTE